MTLRRGFKREAQAIAEEVRADLQLGPLAALDPRVLAAHLDIPIVALSSYSTAIPTAVHHFSHIEPACFSAVTVFHGRVRTVVHNDSHTPARQTSNIAHELAHALLLHPPTPPLNEHGCRDSNQDLEDEANYLGPLLLVSDRAAVHIALHNIPIAQAAQEYGVSVPLIQYRLNVSGAYTRSARIRRQ